MAPIISACGLTIVLDADKSTVAVEILHDYGPLLRVAVLPTAPLHTLRHGPSLSADLYAALRNTPCYLTSPNDNHTLENAYLNFHPLLLYLLYIAYHDEVV